MSGNEVRAVVAEVAAAADSAERRRRLVDTGLAHAALARAVGARVRDRSSSW